MRRGLIALAGLVVVLAATTWWALESGGVAVVETTGPGGAVRATHVWYVEPGGELWLEAGSPDQGWYRDVQPDPRLAFTADGRTTRYLARPDPRPAAQRRVRALLRDKHGLRDRWVGLWVDA